MTFKGPLAQATVALERKGVCISSVNLLFFFCMFYSSSKGRHYQVTCNKTSLPLRIAATAHT